MNQIDKILDYTKKNKGDLFNPNQSNKIIQSIFKKHYHVDTMLEGYNGTIILKFMS